MYWRYVSLCFAGSYSRLDYIHILCLQLLRALRSVGALCPLGLLPWLPRKVPSVKCPFLGVRGGALMSGDVWIINTMSERITLPSFIICVFAHWLVLSVSEFI